MTPKVAALYVSPSGPYWNHPLVDSWEIDRDARNYDGPLPIIAHPPCERWGRYWQGGPSARTLRTKGDDSGCFAHALASVKNWGGVIEHPEASSAWKAFGLNAPPRNGGWVRAEEGWNSWTCCVEQGHYGHIARKMTWLYVSGLDPRLLPDLIWGRSSAGFKFTSQKGKKAGTVAWMKKCERPITPLPFARTLIRVAMNCKPAL